MANCEASALRFRQSVSATNHQAESDADMPLLTCLSRTWAHIQGNLFPWLTEELGPLTDMHKQVVTTLELAGVEAFVRVWPGLPGRPPCDRAALARAFIAKAVLGLPMTAMLIERLTVDKQLRRLCGWEHPGELPSEATFSRAFAEFARSALPCRLHEALIKRSYEDRLVGHLSRDSTAIEAREKPVKSAAPAPSKRKRGRPKKGEVVEKKEPRRIERQAAMSLAEMLADLPTHCAVGTKRNQGPHHQLDRLQAASRHCRWRCPDQRRADVGFVARLPGRDPAGDDERRPRDQPL